MAKHKYTVFKNYLSEKKPPTNAGPNIHNNEDLQYSNMWYKWKNMYFYHGGGVQFGKERSYTIMIF